MSRFKRRRKKLSFFDKVDLSSLDSAEPLCSHFGLCGGCRFQNISYDSQLALKKDYLKDIFSFDFEIVPAISPFNYRNRMDFVFNDGVLGLRKKGDFKFVVDITSCSLIPTKFQSLFSFVKTELSERNISSYDIISQEGFLRYVVFRFAPNSGESMLIFTSKSPVDEVQDSSFRDFLSLVSSQVDSVYWFINDGLGDVSIPLDSEPFLILGKPLISEKLFDLSFFFGPKSFFQANSLMSEIVFKDIRSWVLPGELMDLCCGVGVIGLSVADKVRSVVGVESVSEAIDIARLNAKNNNVNNALFFVSDMKDLLDFAPLNLDTLVVDPPRAGLGSKVVKRVLSLLPERIIYMSCNPKTQKIDLDLLLASENYKIVFSKAYDMFPQTDHLETLIVLDRV